VALGRAAVEEAGVLVVVALLGPLPAGVVAAVVWPQVDLPLASSVQTQPKSSAGFCPSTTHAVQPSLLVGLPSSHCSSRGACRRHTGLARQAMPGTGQSHPAPMVLQSEEQPSLVLLMGAVLPSSQTS
jgi:hypothetical protein